MVVEVVGWIVDMRCNWIDLRPVEEAMEAIEAVGLTIEATNGGGCASYREKMRYYF